MARLIHSAPVGGFFELHEPDGATSSPSVLEAWTQGRPYVAFVNARSAFAALVGLFPGATVWLPAYICTDLVDDSYRSRVRFYAMLESGEPDLDVVDASAKKGDILLILAYFGASLSPSSREFVLRRDDLRVVEDRAQALNAAVESGAYWCLYSPRKLFGVADGGILVARDESVILPRPKARPVAVDLWRPSLLRYEDPTGSDNAAWHAANQIKEGAMAATSQAMTRLSLSIMSRTSHESLTRPRLANWQTLDRALRAWSALRSSANEAPLGYVLRLDPERRDALLRRLHEARIFAAVHWAKIAAPAADFPREWRWTQEIMTLPCDHRYGPAEMERIASCVTQVLS